MQVLDDRFGSEVRCAEYDVCFAMMSFLAVPVSFSVLACCHCVCLVGDESSKKLKHYCAGNHALIHANGLQANSMNMCFTSGTLGKAVCSIILIHVTVSPYQHPSYAIFYVYQHLFIRLKLLDPLTL